MNRTLTSEFTAAIGAVIAVAAYLGLWPLVGTVAVLTLGVAIGWPWLLDLPSPKGSSVIIALSSLTSLALVVLNPQDALLLWLPTSLGLAVLLTFVHELFRRDGRPRLVESVTGTIAGIVVGTFAAGWVAAWRMGMADFGVGGGKADAIAVVVTGAVALAVAAALSGLPLRSWPAVGLMILGSTLAAGVLAKVLPEINWVSGALIGLLIGIIVTSVRKLFAFLPSAGRWPGIAAAVGLPVSASGLSIYIIGLIGTMFVR